jgi:hypothetical protein
MTVTISDPKALEFLLGAELHAESLQSSVNRLDLLGELLLTAPEDFEIGAKTGEKRSPAS